MHKATLRLFNAVQVDGKQKKDVPRSVLERTVKNGYVLDPAIEPKDKLLDIIEDVVGISGEKANAAFHKSWTVVQNSSMESLIVQQILHYFTTYGFEKLGIYRENAVYIPPEKLDLPELKDDIPLTVIKAMEAGEILEKIIELGSGIALAQETLDDIMAIVEANRFDSGFVEKIGNRELKVLLYDFYDVVPTDPEEFLRRLVSKLTDESLIIKNDDLIEKIKDANGKFLDVLIKDAPDNLASIFFRFKPLFLAMKSISRNKTFFNQLRKKADKLHVPVPEDYLNSVTARIKHGRFILSEFEQWIEAAGIFRKIRLAYALNHRMHHERSIVYRVRNGRGWAMEFEWSKNLGKTTQAALDMVLDSIAGDMGKNVTGKTFYIPHNVHYTLPATEKQFTGFLPTGSYITVPEDLVVGIHWTNTNQRVDLDLSVIGESGKIGWDAAFRSRKLKVLFSGDMTDAPPPNGATELFYLKKGTREPKILMVNYYNFHKGAEVECKILAAHERPKKFSTNYMVDVNNIVAAANINVNKKQTILGLIANINCENRVYFASVGIGNSITSNVNNQSMHVRKYLTGSMVHSLDLGEILTRAGATVVDEKPDGEYIDLSPNVLDKTTIIDLIRTQ